MTLSPFEAARAAGLAPDDKALAKGARAGGDNTARRPAGIGVDRVRIGMLGDRPVYRFGSSRRGGAVSSAQIVFADTGEMFTYVGRAEAESIARRYVPGYDGPYRYDGYLTEPDQWTLQARGRLPMHRFALDDADDTRLYVSFLYYERPLWDLVVIVLSIGGAVVSATTLVPTWRRLRRHAGKLRRKRP